MLNKLTIKELKEIINMFEKEANYGSMKKAELVAHVEHLQKAGKIRKTFADKETMVRGAGLFDFFRAPKQDFNNTSKNTLKRYGQYPIKRLQIIRTPIMKILDKVINFISLGKWNTEKTKYNFDQLFHLGLIATLQTPNGERNILLEKNEVVNISPNVSIKSNSELMDVPLKRQLTLQYFVDYALQRTTKDKFFLYNAVTNNCQDFIRLLLHNNGLNNTKVQNFVKQQVEDLIKKMPSIVKPIMNTATNIGARVNQAIGGSKFEDMKNQMSNTDKNKEFWEKNEAIKKQLNNKANFDNREYIADKKEEKRILKIKAEKFMNRLKEKGYDPESGIDAGEWLHDYYKETGLYLKSNKDGYNYDWAQSRLPKTFSELIPSGLRKILKYTGTEGIIDGISNIVSAGEKFYKKPSLNNAVKIGTSTADVVKQGVNAYTNPQSVIKGVAQTAVKDALSGGSFFDKHNKTLGRLAEAITTSGRLAEAITTSGRLGNKTQLRKKSRS